MPSDFPPSAHLPLEILEKLPLFLSLFLIDFHICALSLLRLAPVFTMQSSAANTVHTVSIDLWYCNYIYTLIAIEYYYERIAFQKLTL